MMGIKPAHGGFTIHCLDPLDYICPYLPLPVCSRNYKNFNFYHSSYFVSLSYKIKDKRQKTLITSLGIFYD